MFRNDLDAALARAQAAERELDELRRSGGEDRKRAEKLETALAEAKAELERLRAKDGGGGGGGGKRQRERDRQRERERAAKSSSSDATPRKPRAKQLFALGGVLATGGLIAGLFFGDRACQRQRALHSPGELYNAHLVQSHDGQPRLLVVSEAIQLKNSDDGGSKWRIDLVDLATGKRLARKVWFDSSRDDRPELLPAGPGRFWCDLDGSYVGKRQLLELCDVDTLGVAASTRALIAKSPALAGGLSYSPEVDLGSGALLVTTKSAEKLIIDSKELVARPFRGSKDTVCLQSYEGGGQVRRSVLEAAYAAKFGRTPQFQEGDNCASLGNESYRDLELRAFLRELPRLASLGRSADGATPSLVDPYSFQAVEGGPREGLFRDGEGFAKLRVGDATFIDPEVLTEYGHDDRGIVLPGDAGVIVVHQDSMDRNSASVLLSRMSLTDGQVHWTLQLPAGEVLMGHLMGDVAIVALRLFHDRQSVVVAIAWQDGSERWRYKM